MAKDPKRVAAAKKAAATRKKNEEEEAAANAANDNPDGANDNPNPDEGQPPYTGEPEYAPSHPPLENAGLDQHAAEENRQAELQEQRDEHNERVGDVSR